MDKNKLFRIIIVIMLLSCSVVFFACSKKEKENNNKKANNFDIKETVKVAEDYMDNLMKGDYSACKDLYSDKFKSESKIPPSITVNEMPIMGYKIEETNQVGYSGMIKVDVTRASFNSTYGTLHQYIIKISKKDNKYLIDSIVSNALKETFSKGTTIRIRSKDDVNTNLLTNFSGIPKYAFSKDDKGEMFKLKVPMQSFGPCAISYSGEEVCVSTTDSKDSYLAIISVDESMKTQGDEQKTGTGNSESSTSGGEEIKETPVGKNIFSLDMLRGAKVIHIVFSLDESFLEISYERPNYGKFIRIYNTSNGDMISFSFEEEYNIKNNDVEFVKFSKKFAVYKVIPKDNKQMATLWQLDLKDFKSTKIE